MEGVNFNSASILEKDKSVTYNKLDDNLRYDVDSSRFVDTIQFGGCPLLMNYESRFTSQQGMTTIDDRYIVTCIYVNKDDQGTAIASSRMLVVYDIVDKVEKSHQIFTETQLGNVNSIAYDDGYIYISTLNSNNKIAKLKWNSSTFTFSDLSYINPPTYVTSVAANEGKFIVIYQDGNKVRFCSSFDLNSVELLFEYTFGYVGLQGLHFDGKYIYYCNSSYIPGPGESVTSDLLLYTEQIYIFDLQGNLYRCFSFSRGKYGEIEDCSTVEVSGTKFILVSTNLTQNTACIEVSALSTDSNVSDKFDVLPFDQNVTNFNQFYSTLYVDGSTTDKLFARGTSRRPFPNLTSALIIIRRLHLVCKMFISNLSFNSLSIVDMPVMLHFHFVENVEIKYDLYISGCPHIIFDAQSSTSCIIYGTLTLENTTVSGRYLPALKSTSTTTPKIAVIRAHVAGYSNFIDNTQPNWQFIDGVLNLLCPNTWVAPSDMDTICTRGLVRINGVIYGSQLHSS